MKRWDSAFASHSPTSFIHINWFQRQFLHSHVWWGRDVFKLILENSQICGNVFNIIIIFFIYVNLFLCSSLGIHVPMCANRGAATASSTEIDAYYFQIDSHEIFYIHSTCSKNLTNEEKNNLLYQSQLAKFISKNTFYTFESWK